MSDVIEPVSEALIERAKAALGRRNLVFVGLMGAGKSAMVSGLPSGPMTYLTLGR